VTTQRAIPRLAGGAAVTYRNPSDQASGWSGFVVATLKHGSDYINTAELARLPSLMVEAHCSHVTRVQVTEPGGSHWTAGDQVDVPTMYLVAGEGSSR
jgi:hypothetical protein